VAVDDVVLKPQELLERTHGAHLGVPLQAQAEKGAGEGSMTKAVG
jgi:hypothetical protein